MIGPKRVSGQHNRKVPHAHATARLENSRRVTSFISCLTVVIVFIVSFILANARARHTQETYYHAR